MKRFFSYLVPVLGMSVVLLAGCGGQETSHNYSSDWSYDESYHWHECTDEGCSEVEGKAAHTFGSAVVTTEATGKTEGVKTYTCSVCGYEKTESIPALGNSIAFKADYSLDKVFDGIAVVAPTSENYTTDSDGAVSVSWYQGEALLSEAPINAGSYKVKLSVAETSTCVATSATLEFAISKKALKFSAAVYYQTTAYSFDLNLGAISGVIASDVGKVRTSFTLGGYVVGTYTGTEGIKNLLLKPAPAITDDTAYLNYSISESDVSVEVAKWSIITQLLGFKTTYLDTLNRDYDGTAVSAPTTADLKSVYFTNLDVSFLEFTTKWYDMSDPTDPTLLTEAPKDAGDYKFVLTFEANSFQYAGTLEKEFTITAKKLTTNVFNFYYDSESWHYVDLYEADGLVAADLGKSFNLGISLNDTTDAEGGVIKSTDTGTFTGDAIQGIYITYDTGSGVTSESDNYQLADNTVVNVLQNTDYVGTITMTQDAYAINFPEAASSVGSATLPSFVTASYKSVTRINDGIEYYLSNDPDHPAYELVREDADYDFNVRVPATGNYAGKTFTKTAAFHFYPETSFGAIPAAAINLTSGSHYCYKITADASKTSHTFAVTNGPLTALGSVKVFDATGANVSIARGKITIASSGSYYIVFTASSSASGYTVSYTEA